MSYWLAKGLLAPSIRFLAVIAILPAVLIWPVQGAANEFASEPLVRQSEPAQPAMAGQDLRPLLSGQDKLALLRAIHIALSEVEDGATYVWHRHNGRLNGSFKPTRSFRDAQGRTCRHLVVRLSAGQYGRGTEGIACRLKDGDWALEG